MQREERPFPFALYCARPACRAKFEPRHAEDLPSALALAREASWPSEDRCPACARIERFKEDLHRNPPPRAARERVAREAARRREGILRSGHGPDGAPFYLIVESRARLREDEAPDHWAFAIDAALLEALAEPSTALGDVPVEAVEALRGDSEPFDWLQSDPSRSPYVSLAMSGECYRDLSDALEGGMILEAEERLAALVMTMLNGSGDEENAR